MATEQKEVALSVKVTPESQHNKKKVTKAPYPTKQNLQGIEAYNALQLYKRKR